MKQKIKIFFFFLLLLSSCKTTKQVSVTQLPKDLNTQKVIEYLKLQDNIQSMNASKIIMNLKLDNREFNVTSSFSMIKDSAIHISIQPFLGLELYKLEITPQIIKIFDKINQKYYVVNYEFLSNRLGIQIDFYHLQALLTNRYFCLADNENGCRILTNNPEKINLGFENENFKQSLTIIPNFYIHELLLLDKKSNSQLLATYDDFDTQDRVLYPRKVSIQVNHPRKNIYCDITISKVSFNKEIKLVPTDEKRFKRAFIEQLLQK